MSLSEAYGGKPDYTILSLSQFQNDMKLMGWNDKTIYDCKIKVDDDLQLYDLMCTIKNLNSKENVSSILSVSPEI